LYRRASLPFPERPLAGVAYNPSTASAEAAVTVMVKGIAIDLAGRGITVNNIQPGPTVTDMTVDHIGALEPLIPLKRAEDPDEIAGLVAHLARQRSQAT
jgi:3-oxoacyl-[acyl-carrier protein] reductase